MKVLEKDNPTSRFDVTQTVVETKDFVHEPDVVISSFDYVAYAELYVKAVDRDGNPVNVLIQGKERNTIFLPKAEKGGLIADAWRAKEGVEGLPDSWDEAEVKGQSAKGEPTTIPW